MTRTNTNAVIVAAWVVTLVGIAFAFPANASYGSCVAPPAPHFSGRLQDANDATVVENQLMQYLADVGRYKRCLINYAVENKTSLSATDVRRLGEVFDDARKEMVRAAESWNAISVRYNKKQAKR